MLHRMWPGTQRLLMWGDPVMKLRRSGRASSFCGSDGIEICEPLSFKGRKGSGPARWADRITADVLTCAHARDLAEVCVYVSCLGTRAL